MLILEMKCGMCGNRFEAKALDNEDARERHQHGTPIRCPKCNSSVVEKVRTIRQVERD